MLVVQTAQQFLLTELSLLSPQDISALVRLLSLAEQILSWDFSHYHILLVFSMCLLRSLTNGHLSLHNIKLGRVNIAVLIYTVLVTHFYVLRNGRKRFRKQMQRHHDHHHYHCHHPHCRQLSQMVVTLPWHSDSLTTNMYMQHLNLVKMFVLSINERKHGCLQEMDKPYLSGK